MTAVAVDATRQRVQRRAWRAWMQREGHGCSVEGTDTLDNAVATFDNAVATLDNAVARSDNAIATLDNAVCDVRQRRAYRRRRKQGGRGPGEFSLRPHLDLTSTS